MYVSTGLIELVCMFAVKGFHMYVCSLTFLPFQPLYNQITSVSNVFPRPHGSIIIIPHWKFPMLKPYTKAGVILMCVNGVVII